MGSVPVKKRILLIDLEDPRRETRVKMLSGAGYEVKVRTDWVAAHELEHEGTFDLVLLAIHQRGLKSAVDYGERLHAAKSTLPILLLTDVGVFAPRGTLNVSMEGGDPVELMREVASMLAGSTHIREIDSRSVAAD